MCVCDADVDSKEDEFKAAALTCSRVLLLDILNRFPSASPTE